MSIQRWDPFEEALSLRDAMNRLLEESVIWPPSLVSGPGTGLALDLEESPENYTVRATLPGFRPEDVDVSVVGDTLTIQAQRQNEEERAGRNYLIRERRAGAVSRSIRLPRPVDVDKARARYEHGELVLTLPKAEESRPRRIAIGGQSKQLGRGHADQFGYEAGRSERYRGQEFEEAEPTLRSEYEQHHKEGGGLAGAWERLREEIRAGWNRARGR